MWGSQAVLMAGQYLFDKELTVPCHVYTANEFNYAIPKGLSENSLVITCSPFWHNTRNCRSNKKSKRIWSNDYLFI